MTEYEIADIAAAVMANFLTALTVFLSVVSAYVISALVAGDRLTKAQLTIVNGCFVVAATILGYLVVSLYRRFFALVQSVSVERGPIGDIDFSIPLCLLLVAIILGCFVFMWSARSSDAEQETPDQ